MMFLKFGFTICVIVCAVQAAFVAYNGTETSTILSSKIFKHISDMSKDKEISSKNHGVPYTTHTTDQTGQIGNKNKLEIFSAKKQKTVAADSGPIVYTYRLDKNDDSDTPCTLMTVDAMLSFVFMTKLGEQDETDLFLPSKVPVTGDCMNSQGGSSFVVKWDNNYKLTFLFSKTPGGEKWFVSNIQLDFSTQDTKQFNHIIYPNANIHATTNEKDVFFKTPMGKAYKCHNETEIILKDPSYEGITVELLLREFTIQPFITEGSNFGPEYSCTENSKKVFRNEDAPFIFGLIMGLTCLGIVVGYGLYVHYKVNKVHYDTME